MLHLLELMASLAVSGTVMAADPPTLSIQQFLGDGDCPSATETDLINRGVSTILGFPMIKGKPYENAPQGIDVSKHNRYVSFDKLRACGARFTYIRVSYGAENIYAVEPAAETLWRNAHAAGLHVGPYHFLTLPRELDKSPPTDAEIEEHARRQARDFARRLRDILKTLPGEGAKSELRHMPIVLDLERRALSSGERKKLPKDLSSRQMAPIWIAETGRKLHADLAYKKAACAWFDEIGKDPTFGHQKFLVYSSANFLLTHRINSPGAGGSPDCALNRSAIQFWIARYTPSTKLFIGDQGRTDLDIIEVCALPQPPSDFGPCIFHQYSESGQFGFIGSYEKNELENRRLDLNRFHGSDEALAAGLQKASVDNAGARLPVALADALREPDINATELKSAFDLIRTKRLGTKRSLAETANCRDDWDAQWAGYTLLNCAFPTDGQVRATPTLAQLKRRPPDERQAWLLNVPIGTLGIWTESSCRKVFGTENRSKTSRTNCISAVTERIQWNSHGQFFVRGYDARLDRNKWFLIEYRDGVAVASTDPTYDGVARRFAPATEIGTSPRQWADFVAKREGGPESDLGTVMSAWRPIVRRERLASLESGRNRLIEAWIADCLSPEGMITSNHEKRGNICRVH